MYLTCILKSLYSNLKGVQKRVVQVYRVQSEYELTKTQGTFCDSCFLFYGGRLCLLLIPCQFFVELCLGPRHSLHKPETLNL